MTPLLIAFAAVAGMHLAGEPRAGAATGLAASAFDRAPAPSQPAKPGAPASISSDVMVLHATNDSSGTDPKLLQKLPALSKPPFSSYNSYKLLQTTSLALARGSASPLKLPTGRELRVVYKDVVDPQNKGDVRRYVVTVSIQKADGKSFLPLVEVNAKAGEWFWVGGQEYKGGSLFIGIKINP